MRTMIVIALCPLLAGCPGSSDPLEALTQRIESGASCADLFEARNAIDPHAPNLPKVNQALRDIGCYSSSSTRSDR
jgi:hypothetical protein